MKKLISFLLALAIPLYALPLAAGAEGDTSDYYDLKAALNSAQANSTIIIPNGKKGFVNDTNSNAAPWIINKPVTIEGTDSNTILLIRSGGIILQADVTFKNVKISLENRVRNVIMANGHTLTLDNVTRDTSACDIHLACGGLVDSNHTVSSTGSLGQIVIKNCNSNTTFGNIYAGNISGGQSGNNLGNFPFSHPATVSIESSSACKTGALYGCGALETPVDDNQMLNPNYVVDPPTPNYTRYPVTGDVTFNLYYNTVPVVDGDMGNGKKADVQYVCGPYLNSSLTLNNISRLTLAKNGSNAGALQPTAGSSLSGTNLTVPAGTTLNLSNISSPTVNDFSGGGTLVLGKNQQLTINGTVSGETKVGIGSVSNNGLYSNTVITAGTTYIKTPVSPSGTFKLLPYQAKPTMKLNCDSNGNWTTYDSGASVPETKVQSLAIPNQNITANTGAKEIKIPYTAALTNPGDLSDIPLTVTMNGSSVTNAAGDYSWNISNVTYYLGYSDDLSFLFTALGGTNSAIPNGKYNFTVTVPAAETTNNRAISVSFSVTVGDAGNPDTPDPSKPTQIDIPTAKTGLKYTGQEQTGVEAGTGYTLSGKVKGTEIGEYTAWAALKTNYQWKDGTVEAKEIKWSIGKGAAPAAPTGLKAVSPTKKDGRDGEISGTTDKMEYATNSDFSSAKDCTGDTITGLPAGTYYVRVKETDKYEAGSYAIVKVLAFGEVEVVPDPPAEVKVPVSGEEKTVEVTASVSGSTAVVSAIDTTQLGSVIGEKVDTGMVRIDFSGLKQEIDTVELPGSAIREIAAAAQAQSNDVDGLALKLSTGSVSFDAAALDSIQKQAGSKVTLKILEKERQDLTAAQQEIIGTAPTFDISLQGSAAITDFGTGKAAVSLPYALKPGQSAAGIVVYHLGEDKKASACPTQYSQVKKTATYTTSHFSLYFVGFDPSIQWKNPFNDVRKGEWFYEAVEFAELNGLMQGDSKTVFAPNQKLSRAQIAQILYNKESRPRVSGSGSFTDVPAREWYADAVNWAAQKGYVKGYDSSHFGPNDSVTREQLAAILWRYAGEPTGKKAALSSFTDAGKASEYALPALRWAVQNEIIRGKGNNRLDPAGTATRAEVAQMLMNYLA